VTDASIDLADVMIRTNIDISHRLAAGRRARSERASRQPRMTRFVNDIGKRYADRIILFDSPPVLARSEAMVLAQHVRAGRVRGRGRAHLAHGDERALGMIGNAKLAASCSTKPTDAFARGIWIL